MVVRGLRPLRFLPSFKSLTYDDLWPCRSIVLASPIALANDSNIGLEAIFLNDHRSVFLDL